MGHMTYFIVKYAQRATLFLGTKRPSWAKRSYSYTLSTKMPRSSTRHIQSCSISSICLLCPLKLSAFWGKMAAW